MDYLIIAIAALAAFSGAFLGSRWVKKVTIHTLQVAVAAMLFLIAILLGLGII
jgi:uncharacterized membrane protein YfcA